MERTYRFELVGQSDLLMHRDDVTASDELTAVRNEMKKEDRVRGDDRSPAWTWQTYLYDDETHVAMDAANVMSSLRFGATRVQTGKGNKTFKELSQSGIVPATEFFEFRPAGAKDPVPLAAVQALKPKTFAEQVAGVRKLGFDLHVKRARVGQSKHVRVRPRFRAGWRISGLLLVVEPALTGDVLARILAESGKGGLGDWRPSSPTPGVWGRYTATIRLD